jgi:phosphoserine phosphatase
MAIATLIAADAIDSGTISAACDRLASAGCNPAEIEWLEPAIAVDIGFEGDVEAARAALAPLESTFDIVVQHSANRRKMLLVSDMDSTMITVECIDELADYAGIKSAVAAITDRAMAGKLDFAEALTERVALLAGMSQDVIAQCLAERVHSTKGAETLVRTMAAWGAHTILVSGGFTQFAIPIAARIGLAEVHANILEISNGQLTGKLDGPIVDALRKREVLMAAAAQRGIDPAAILSVGDGANDLPMIAAAVDGGGLGAGYHPRPQLALAANFSIRHNDLTALLFEQGIRSSDWLKG